MRNAERYLAQGKIQSAIGEYKQVVANDPKDFGTLNMLGDLYTKNSDKPHAVKCYTAVAEHYSKQGFAQKAIAVYNKITKLQPGSIEISAKLAELYRFKGSLNEARVHYKTVAEQYERDGKKLEALEIRKQIASLDPNDEAIQLKLAEDYLAEDQHDDAADAFAEAGVRLAKKGRHSEAVEALGKALDIKPTQAKFLAAFVQSHFELATPSAAAERLNAIHLNDPHDREVVLLLIDCHLEAGNTADAEKSLIGLVEKEPANYPKLVSLTRTYVGKGDAEGAARTMAMLSEHLLLAGEAEEFQSLINEILTLDPEQIEGLRLRARLAVWQRDEAGMQDALTQLATVARSRESVDDERYALSQLVMIAPHETAFTERLKELNELHGFDDSYDSDNLFDQQFMKAPKQSEPELETFAPELSEVATLNDDEAFDGYADFAIVGSSITEPVVTTSETAEPEGPESDSERLQREVDSIRFYIDSGYYELADKAIGELTLEFGSRVEIDELVQYLGDKQKDEHGEEAAIEVDSASIPQLDLSNTVIAQEPVASEVPAAEPVSTNGNHAPVTQGFGIDDLRNELGLDEVDSSADSDYDTHYHTAVAYQEMGLLDEAVREYQDAVALVQPNDPSRRFFHCANLLGHCFMQKAMPHLALKWYQRALETPGLSDEEKQGIWYELASAYEAEGDVENAGRYFEQVYAENIDFRDVSDRVKNISVGR
jgi:tetratricopeptide (TPR) repeat protein